jgi:hypothetical protein
VPPSGQRGEDVGRAQGWVLAQDSTAAGEGVLGKLTGLVILPPAGVWSGCPRSMGCHTTPSVQVIIDDHVELMINVDILWSQNTSR